MRKILVLALTLSGCTYIGKDISQRPMYVAACANGQESACWHVKAMDVGYTDGGVYTNLGSFYSLMEAEADQHERDQVIIWAARNGQD